MSPKRDFEAFTNSRFVALAFLLLRNDYLWALLSPRQRELILRNNILANEIRDDFVDPSLYNKGEDFLSDGDRCGTYKGRWIQEFLDTYSPRRVIEFGPGSGYYSRMIVEHPGVEEYCAVDLNPKFVEHLGAAIRSLGIGKSVDCLVGGIDLDLDRRFDGLVVISAVHHIPNRVEMIKKFAALLENGGVMFFLEPTHYIPRLKKMISKARSPGYIRVVMSGEPSAVGTHNFCSIGEFSKICGAAGNLRIEEAGYWGGGKSLAVRAIEKVANLLRAGTKSPLRRTVFHKYLSTAMYVVIRKDEHRP